MIVEFDKEHFLEIMKKKELQLPKKWDGIDFYKTINIHLKNYKKYAIEIMNHDDYDSLEEICSDLLKVVENYYAGIPSTSFFYFTKLMKIMIENPFLIYNKTCKFVSMDEKDELNLYRVRKIEKKRAYKRKEIFHMPFSKRANIDAYRYSIAGYPCLYLATNVELCCNEIKAENKDLLLGSRFNIIRNYSKNGKRSIKVIELALKPNDFLKENLNLNDDRFIIENRRTFDEIDLTSESIMKNYLFWYPLISACSFIRESRKKPFAAEYIVPQIFMQWLKKEATKKSFFGLRYFSCSSLEASELGFNYVFPVYGYSEKEFCDVLTSSFKLTNPKTFYCDEKKYIEAELNKDKNLENIKL